jgi:hypothetical protein
MLKIIQNEKIIDVVRVPHYLKFLSSGHVAITDKGSAQGIAGSDKKSIYSFAPVEHQTAGVVTIEEISAEEFERLQLLLKDGKEISADEKALADAKRIVIKRLSNNCKSKITEGFSIKLSDGKFYNFKLTTEDQLNLMILESQLASDTKTFIYHATDQPCKFFTREDVLKIISAFKQHVLYHTTYFNAAKQYIKSLLDIKEVNLFTYGTDISDTVDNPSLGLILKNGGGVE